MDSLLVCLALAAPAAEHLEEFVRGDIEVKTDLAKAEMDEVFTLIETTRAATVAFLERLDVSRKSTQSLRIRLYAHEADYEDFRRRTFEQRTDIHQLSLYNDQDRTIGAAWVGGSDKARGELRGQVARQMLLNYGKNPPPWLREAVFALLEGLETDGYGDAVDLLNRGQLATIRGAIEREELCPLYELMDLRDPQFYGIAGAPNNSKWPRQVLY